MKNKLCLLLPIIAFIASCTQEIYPTNGETIYRTGKNLDGQRLLDKDRSQIKFIKSCQGCHGSNGNRTPDCGIKWSHLTDANALEVPYNDSLFFRFLDEDIKSNGNAAQTGVHWDMSMQDKQDLLDFLKTL